MSAYQILLKPVHSFRLHRRQILDKSVENFTSDRQTQFKNYFLQHRTPQNGYKKLDIDLLCHHIQRICEKDKCKL